MKYIKFRGKSWKKTTGLLIDPLYILTKRTKCKPLSLFLAGWKGYSLPVVPSVGRIVNAGGRVQHELSLWNEITSRIEQEMTIYLNVQTWDIEDHNMSFLRGRIINKKYTKEH